MRILIWNARGLGDDDKNETIQKTLHEANADFICLQETKLTEILVFKARNFLPPRLTEFVYQPSEGASAGLIIAWNPKKIIAFKSLTAESMQLLSQYKRVQTTHSLRLQMCTLHVIMGKEPYSLMKSSSCKMILLVLGC
jgi:exonuclease III